MMSLLILLPWVFPAQPGADGPTVSTVAIALSGVVMLALIKVTVDNRDENRTYRQLLFGVPGETKPTGLVDQVTRIGLQLEGLVNDVKNQRETIKNEVVNAATLVTMQAQEQFAQRIEELGRKIETLSERRDPTKPRPL